MKRFLNLALTAIMLLNTLCTLSFASSGSGQPVTESYISIADGGYDSYPTWKGNTINFSISRKNIYTSAITRCGFIKFDLTPVRQKLNNDYVVSSAEVKLTVYNSTSDTNQRVALYAYNSDGWSDEIPATPLSGTSLSDVNTHIVSKDPANPSNNYVVIQASVEKTDETHPTYTLDVTDHFKQELAKPSDNELSFEVNYRTSGTSKTYSFYTKEFTGDVSYKPTLVVTYKPKEYKSAVTRVLVNGENKGLSDGTANVSVEMKSWDDESHSACLFGALYKKDALGNEIMTDIKAIDSLTLTKNIPVNKSITLSVPSDADYFARVWVTDSIGSAKVFSNEFEITSAGITSDGSKSPINKFILTNAFASVNRTNGGINISADISGANKPFGVLVLKDGVDPGELTASNISENVCYASAAAGELAVNFKLADETIIYDDFKVYVDNMGMASQEELSFTYYLDSLPDQVFGLMKTATSDGELANILETYSSLIGITIYDEVTMASMASALYPVNDENITKFSERYTMAAATQILTLAADSAGAMSAYNRFADVFNINSSLKFSLANPNLPAFAKEGFYTLAANNTFTTSNVKSKLETLFIKAAVTNAPRYGDLSAVFQKTNLIGGYFDTSFNASKYAQLKSKDNFYKKLILLPLDTVDNIKSSIISAAASAYTEENPPSSQSQTMVSRPVGSISSPSVSVPSVNPNSPAPQTPSVNSSFADVTKDMWMFEYVSELSKKGVVSGYEDGSFRPEKTITREEFVKLICEAAQIKNENAKFDFDDIETSRWSYKYIAAAVNAGIVNGISKNTFAPVENITRQDAAVIISRVLGEKEAKASKTFADADSVSAYAINAVEILSSLGILTGDNSGNFRPQDSLTRAETCALISRFIKFL